MRTFFVPNNPISTDEFLFPIIEKSAYRTSKFQTTRSTNRLARCKTFVFIKCTNPISKHLRILKMENLHFLYIFSSLIFFLSVKLSLAADTITPTTLIRDGDKLVSSSQRFELGFFSRVKSRYRYLGIWYKQVPETPVWVANRKSPIIDQNAVLTISRDGNLVLLNQTNGTIWSSNMSTKAENPVAQLLDTGNFVIRDNSSSNTRENYLWQSFDYPSDTLLQGMKLGWDFKNGLERYLTSWRSADDPSPGNFTLVLDIQVLPKICIYKGSAIYSSSGPWNGESFVGVPSNTTFLFQPTMVQNEDEVYYSYESYSNPTIMILRLNPLGQIQRLVWHEMSIGWQVFSSAPNYSCEHYGNCAANSICYYDQTPNCKCLEGFNLESQHNQTWPKTCVRIHSLDCKSGDRFIKLDDIKLPDLQEVSLNQSMNLMECEAECLKNCSCRAYANSEATGGGSGSGCIMWFGELLNLRKTIGNINGMSVYIRVPASEPGNKKLLWIVVIAILPVALLSFYILCRWRRKQKEKETMTTETNHDLLLFDINMGITTRSNEFSEGDGDAKGKGKESVLPLFSLTSVAAATKCFSMQSKLGEGGFGPVYKGQLFNGQNVAVKRLSCQSGQGIKEFKNEMMLIVKLQHRNLIRLLGCCIEQGEKILIYEYMPNKSLDFFLFHPTKKHMLGWQARVKIIEGIAQGLLYLHQYSRLRIIHRDLKASNILLDSDMVPKISDFGMARMFGGDDLLGNTKRIVGTFGYMSPEYALRGIFSIKSDVFSFGVLLLETLGGKKNTEFHNTESLTLLDYAWNLWKDGRAWNLLDPLLQVEASYPLLKRYINVALLCVQENAADRPTMSEVVSMLKNEIVNLPSPLLPAFSFARIMENSALPANREGEGFTANCLTYSVMDAR